MPKQYVKSRSAAVGRREPRVGDVRIVQIKSKIGATRAQRESLQSLRLGRIGRSSEVDVARPVVLGQIHSVRHLTEIRPLTATGQFWAAVKRPDRVLIEDPVPYTVRDHQAVCVPLSDGARFIVEARKDSYGLSWTSLISVAVGLDRVGDLLELDAGRRAIILPAGAKSAFERRIMSIPEACDTARGRVLDFLRLEFDDLDVTLEAARLPRHVAEPIEAGEVGLEARTFDRKLCVALLESTGAPSIGNHADALVEIASDMTAHLGADR